MPVHTRGRGVASQFRLRDVPWLKVREAKAKAAEIGPKVREAKAAEKAKKTREAIRRGGDGFKSDCASPWNSLVSRLPVANDAAHRDDVVLTGLR